MKGSFLNTSSSRTEIFSKNALVTVFSDAESCPEPLQFARQVATLKEIQAYYEPFYVMDMGRVNQLVDQWTSSLPRVQPYYSVNCNNDPVLLKLLAANRFVGFNCLTNQNVEDALEFVSSDRILYFNPVWTRASLKQAAAKDINMLFFENSRDLDRILLHHPTAELVLHICINNDSEDPAAAMGCEVEVAAELLQLGVASGANIVGISFNLGSGVRPSLYATAIEACASLFELGLALGLPMNVLNLGCGFSSLDENFPVVCTYINDSLDYYFPVERFPRLRILATPGRFFAGSVFSLVTSIIGRRSIDLSNITNDDFDAGQEAFIYQTNEGYYGGFGCRVNAIEPECVPLFDNYMDKFTSEHVYGSVIGPSLDSLDVIQSICRFRPLSAGDWLMWNNMGAYSLNNRGSLCDDVDTHKNPMVFYFTTENQWEQMNISERVAASPDPNLPTTPVSDFSDDNSSFATDASFSGEDHFYQHNDSCEEKFLMMFGWPLYE